MNSTSPEFESASTAEPPRSGSLYSVLMLCVVVAGYAVLNFLVSPFQNNEPWRLPLMGATFSEPSLFALWASLGPPPAIKRWPATIAALIFVTFVGRIANEEWLSPEYIVFAIGSFCVVATIAKIVSVIRGWRFDDQSALGSNRARENQFSMKFLLIFTTICALLLGTGRLLAGLNAMGESRTWANVVLEMIEPILYISLVLLPAMLPCLLILSRRPSKQFLVALPVVWILLTWATVELVRAMENVPRLEMLRDVVLIQLGAILIGACSAAAVRFAGYRLVRVTRSVSASSE